MDRMEQQRLEIMNNVFRSWLLATEREDKAGETLLGLSLGAVQQLRWWLAALQTCQEGAPIPDIRNWAWQEGVELHSDAAGGAPGAGMGGVALQWKTETERLPWFHITWPEWLNNGYPSPTAKTKLKQKLTCLEGAAALSILSISAEEAKGRTVYLHVDNSGFVFAMAKGHSKCLFAHSMAKAVFDLGQSLGCKLQVETVILKQIGHVFPLLGR